MKLTTPALFGKSENYLHENHHSEASKFQSVDSFPQPPTLELLGSTGLTLRPLGSQSQTTQGSHVGNSNLKTRSTEIQWGHFIYILTQLLNYYVPRYIWNRNSNKCWKDFWELDKLNFFLLQVCVFQVQSTKFRILSPWKDWKERGGGCLQMELTLLFVVETVFSCTEQRSIRLRKLSHPSLFVKFS